MTAQIAYDKFATSLNGAYMVKDSTIELTLVEISERKEASGFENFSLIFEGSEDNILEQGTYELENNKVGGNTIFIVPVAPPVNKKVAHYQACFSRHIDIDED